MQHLDRSVQKKKKKVFVWAGDGDVADSQALIEDQKGFFFLFW